MAKNIVTGVELFAGGGGLLLGSELAGVKHIAAVEWDQWACQTIRENAAADFPLVRDINVIEGDVRDVNWFAALKEETVDVVTGGPPCQPFSLGGLARSAEDPRDMFPAMTETIAKLQPKAFVVENVRGLTRANFVDYLEYIKLRLSHPLLRSLEGETWREHGARLQKEHTSIQSDLSYNLVTSVVNAADYGIPQQRHRVFIIGFRSDVDAEWSFPETTHSGSALAEAQLDSDYWERRKVRKSDRIHINRKIINDGKLPWRTVRDALEGMPEPKPGKDSPRGWFDHRFQPGAKIYPGHTGSPIDQPAKALKAGGHGVPGGENMIRFPDGSVRYFTIREAARLQTFPDEYRLHGAWSEAMRQIGNAVPVGLAEIVMSSVCEHLTKVTSVNSGRQLGLGLVV